MGTLAMTRFWKTFLGAALLGSLAVAVRADRVITKEQTIDGVIKRVMSNGDIVIESQYGDTTVPKAQVEKVEVAEPAAYRPALAALAAKNYDQAIAVLKPLTDRLAGVEVEWVQDALLNLGEAYTAKAAFLDARRAFESFKKLYPNSPKLASIEAKSARILVDRGKHDEAIGVLQRFLEPLLAKKAIIDDEEKAVAEALLLLGDCQRTTGKTDEALDSYLAAVVLFDVDPPTTAEAKLKAAQIFEQKKKWPRAKLYYQDLLQAPVAEIAAAAKKQLEAHPE